MITKLWGEIIQLSGMIFLVIGIIIEIIYKADIGFITITVGSLLYAVGTKIKHREQKSNGRKRNTFRGLDW